MLSNLNHDAFKTSHLFADLSERQLNHIGQHSRITEIAEGSSLFSQGDEVRCFYLVLNGSLKLYRMSPEGKEKVVEIVEAGDTFAEALMFTDRAQYPVTATALVPAKVIAINNKAFKSMLHDSIDTCFVLMAAMSVRLRSLINEIDALSLDTGTMRIAAYLLQQAPPEKNNFELKIAKSVIASRLSVKPETFSRILKHLHEMEVLTIQGRKVIIHDRDAMIDIASC